MAVPETSVVKKNDRNMKKKRQKVGGKPDKNGGKDVLLTAQEIQFVKYLAANDPKHRKKALKGLPKWLKHRSLAKAFVEEDFLIIWKGLFYNMWMSDKPLIQEQCAEEISNLIHSLNVQQSILFFKAGLRTLINEWFGIDQLRLDKFLMFVRRLLRQTIVVIKNNSFKKRSVEQLNLVLEDTILSPRDDKVPIGLAMHFIEIYLEEVAKISEGQYHPEITTEIVRPFIKKLAVTTDSRILSCIRKFVFIYLIRQHDLGLEHQAKYEAWKEQGFPGSIDSMQKVKSSNVVIESENENSEENETNVAKKPLDPRAGRIDVELPQLKFVPKSISEALLAVKFNPETNVKSRAEITTLAEKFKKLGEGVYPLGVKRLFPKKQKNEDTDTINVRKAAKKLIEFEKKLLSKDKNKKRKRKATESVDSFPEAKKIKVDDSLKSVLKKNKKSTKLNGGDVESQTNGTKKKEKHNGTKITQKLKKIEKKKTKKETVENEKKCEANKTATENNSENLEYVFERNSGVWYVYINEDEKGNNAGANSSPKKIEISSSTPESSNAVEKNKKSSPPVLNGSPKTGPQPVRLFNSPDPQKTPLKSTEMFGKPADWDDDLEEGEYELFVPARKYLKKMKKRGKSERVESLISSIRGKNSSSPGLRKMSPKTGSAKKVRINTKLNKSQEIHEHITQIMMSPHNPYDSAKKPGKPLLKTPLKSTPINPFYKLRLNL